jgi:hypothetical protein
MNIWTFQVPRDAGVSLCNEFMLFDLNKVKFKLSRVTELWQSRSSGLPPNYNKYLNFRRRIKWSYYSNKTSVEAHVFPQETDFITSLVLRIYYL